jgi:hypothetical protein
MRALLALPANTQAMRNYPGSFRERFQHSLARHFAQKMATKVFPIQVTDLARPRFLNEPHDVVMCLTNVTLRTSFGEGRWGLDGFELSIAVA